MKITYRRIPLMFLLAVLALGIYSLRPSNHSPVTTNQPAKKSELTWKTTPVEKCEIKKMFLTNIYKMVCSGPYGAREQIMVPPPVPTLTLIATRTEIIAGEHTIVMWESKNTTKCVDLYNDNLMERPLKGSSDFAPQTTTFYRMICTGPGGTIIETVKVTVLPEL